MKIINLGHASFLLSTAKHSIVFDPYGLDSVPGLKFPSGIKADYLFSSHSHFDHNAVELVKKVKPVEDLKYQLKIIPHDKEGGKKRGMNTAVIIEIDGSQHADNVNDLQRTAYLEKQGFKILRFWNIDIARQLKSCLEIIRQFCV